MSQNSDCHSDSSWIHLRRRALFSSRRRPWLTTVFKFCRCHTSVRNSALKRAWNSGSISEKKSCIFSVKTGNPPEPAVSCGYWKLERVLASEQPQTRDHGTDCLFGTAQLVTQIYTPLLVGKWCFRPVISVGTPLINSGSTFWSRNLHIFHQTPPCFDDFENFWKSFKQKHENIFETRDQFRSIALLKMGIE